MVNVSAALFLGDKIMVSASSGVPEIESANPLKLKLLATESSASG